VEWLTLTVHPMEHMVVVICLQRDVMSVMSISNLEGMSLLES